IAQLHKGDDSRIMEDLLSLLPYPTQYFMHSNGYIANGYRFHVEDYEKKLRTQNCGVVVGDENDKIVKALITKEFFKTYEPFISVDQASQVLYDNDNSNKGWQVVRPRDSFNIVEQMDDDIVEIKMKPIKTKNKADSSMKSTIKYTFVAPGAIGKGRRRGKGLNLWMKKDI
ncbi:hypothetical protein H5410_056668, partial [Solanum commersonii]